jgi:hypothetical protein
VNGSWKKSRSSTSRPACKSAALALRHPLHLFHQYSRANSGATGASRSRDAAEVSPTTLGCMEASGAFCCGT